MIRLARASHGTTYTLLALLLILLTALAACSSDPKSCPDLRAIRDLASGGDPAGAALLVTPECAKALAESGEEADAFIAMNAGFISAVVGHLEDEKLLKMIEAAVLQGDHGYVARDTPLPAALLRMAEDNAALAERILAVYDFVLAAQTIGPAQASGSDPARYALFLPVWRDEETRQVFRTFCERLDCGTMSTELNPCVIDDSHELSVKLAFSNDPSAFMGKLEQCRLSVENPDLVLRLRRFGIIDASCTSTMQVNAIAQNGFAAGASCRALLRNISEQSAVSASDVVRYVQMMAIGELKVPLERQAANAVSFGALSPATAKRLSASTLTQ